MIAPFFIIGSGRSGSTLLRMILTSHSRIVIPPETWFIIPLIKELPINSILNIDKIKFAVDLISSHYRWPDMQLDRKKLIDSALSLNNPKLKDILDIIYSHHLDLHKKSRWGDKTPPYIHIVPELTILYPEAKFIHLIRDGHDVSNSFFNLGWNGKLLCKNTSEWKDAINKSLSFHKMDFFNKVFQVKYEELVLNTEQTVRDICCFINEEFEPQMLDWKKSIKDSIPSREMHIHQKLFKQPGREHIYRWKNNMANKDILVIESHIYKEILATGYELKYHHKLWIPIFFLIRSYCNLITMLFDSVKKLRGFLSLKITNFMSTIDG